MASPSVFLLLLAATSAVAQNQIVWGSVVFTYHGEKTPFLISGGNHHLTPLGANQLENAGRAVRERYIALPLNDTSIADFFPIPGLSNDTIVNSQLNLLTPADEIMTASATAFAQGLYPPRNLLYGDEEYNDAQGNYGRGASLPYPLDGYQYPNIRTANTVTDPASIWVAGQTSCDEYSISQIMYRNTSAFLNRTQSTWGFYNNLRSSVFADVDFPTDTLDYRWADQLYEYALFKYSHNGSVFNSPNYTGPDYEPADFTAAQLATLYSLASEQQFGLNSGANASSIAGQTLASMVLQQLERVIVSGGGRNKLSLLFTSHEPFLSFFALAGLSTGPSGSKFKNLPLHGSMMAFELFSYASPSDNSVLPPESDLFVRFLYRNGTAEDAVLAPFSLFGHSPSSSNLQWYDFLNSMEDFAMPDVSEWCSVCATQNVFCLQLQDTPSAGSGGSSCGSISPAVAGAIGAVVTIALALVILIILAFLGFRLQRNDGNPRDSRSDLGALRVSGANGGFKGAERLPSDTDLRLKGGAGATVVRHERVGSWELNDGPRSPPPVYPNLDKDLEHGRISSHADYGRRSEDDGLERVNPFGEPVRPVDQI